MNPWNNANFNNGFNTPSYNSWDRPSGNIQYTPSLEDALSRCNMRNTENVFFHQDRLIFYRIKVDADGRKYWQEFNYSPNAQVDNTPVMRQDLMNFEDRLKAIENILFRKGEVNNEQSDGQISIPINGSTDSTISRS